MTIARGEDQRERNPRGSQTKHYLPSSCASAARTWRGELKGARAFASASTIPLNCRTLTPCAGQRRFPCFCSPAFCPVAQPKISTSPDTAFLQMLPPSRREKKEIAFGR